MSNNIKIFVLISAAFAMMVGSFATLNYLVSKPNNNKLAGAYTSNSNTNSNIESSINSSINPSQINYKSNLAASQVVSVTKEKNQSKTIVKNGITIEFLDKTNQPQYTQDYLNCPTKYLKNDSGKITHYGNFYTDNEVIKYRCPPKMETLGCQKNIVYITDTNTQETTKINGYNLAPYKQGWNCDQFYAWSFVSKQMDPCYGNATEKNIQPEGFVSDRLTDQKCVMFFEKGVVVNEELVEKILARFQLENPVFDLQNTTITIVEK